MRPREATIAVQLDVSEIISALRRIEDAFDDLALRAEQVREAMSSLADYLKEIQES